MRLVMTLLVRDEEDIVDDTIRYHLAQGVDYIIATDNLSVDATPDILRGYEDAGVLQMIRETGDDYEQGRWVTRMARSAATDHGADWVINGDADEFWWPLEGDLKSTLAAIPNRFGKVEKASTPPRSATGSEPMKVYSQLNSSTIMPPMTGPKAGPSTMPMPKMPMPRPR